MKKQARRNGRQGGYNTVGNAREYKYSIRKNEARQGEMEDKVEKINTRLEETEENNIGKQVNAKLEEKCDKMIAIQVKLKELNQWKNS